LLLSVDRLQSCPSRTRLRVQKGQLMVQLAAEDISGLERLIRISNDHQDLVTYRRRVTPIIHRLFHSDSTIFWFMDSGNRMVDPYAVNIDFAYVPPYLTYYYRQNPFDPETIGVPVKNVLTMEERVPLRTFRKTEYYNDFIKPQNIERQMAVYVRSGRKLEAVIGAHRKRSRAFGSRSRTLGGLIALHVQGALNNIRFLEEIKGKEDFYRTLYEHTGIGIAVMDCRIRPVYVNRRAEIYGEKLRRQRGRDAVRLCGGYPMSVESHEDCLRVLAGQGMIHDISGPASTERIVWVSPSERVMVRTRPLPEGLISGKGPFVMVTMEEKDIPGLGDPAGLAKNYLLSRREIEVFSNVLRGRTNAEIAEALYISEGTVKNHLKRIFKKTGVKNRTDLVRKILSLDPAETGKARAEEESCDRDLIAARLSGHQAPP